MRGGGSGLQGCDEVVCLIEDKVTDNSIGVHDDGERPAQDEDPVGVRLHPLRCGVAVAELDLVVCEVSDDVVIAWQCWRGS